MTGVQRQQAAVVRHPYPRLAAQPALAAPLFAAGQAENIISGLQGELVTAFQLP
ncbi:hypothetical protein [Pantoea coffeiphila]|uniref:hypothetical protein n=1 Tax=Pantoea coffeiphila TaxID=1465635 RepID=UPI001558A0A1|nr:hypothetical protein [Pantoea coffeiphila]